MILIPVMLQEGIVRAKLAKLLAGYDDVIYEQSFASGANIKVVCTILIDLVSWCKIDIVMCISIYWNTYYFASIRRLLIVSFCLISVFFSENQKYCFGTVEPLWWVPNAPLHECRQYWYFVCHQWFPFDCLLITYISFQQGSWYAEKSLSVALPCETDKYMNGAFGLHA